MKRLALIVFGVAVVIAAAIILCRKTGEDIACGFDVVDGEVAFL